MSYDVDEFPHTRIPVLIVDAYAAKLGPYAIFVYVILLRHANAAHECEISLQDLRSLTGVSMPTIIESLRALERFDLLVVRRDASPYQGHATNVYVLQSPQPIEIAAATESVPSRRSRSKLSVTKRLRVYAKTDGVCWYCENQVTADTFSVDHRDGRYENDEFDNLVPCCRSCNSAKGQRSEEEYRAWRQFTGAACDQLHS